MMAEASAAKAPRRRLRRTDRRARIAVALVALAIVVAALAVRIADPSLLAHQRNLAFDEYQRLAPRPYDPALPVRIVAIDEASLDTIGQWPWQPRWRSTSLCLSPTERARPRC